MLFNTGNESTNTVFVKPVFLRFDYGTHITRLLGDFRVVWTHFFRGRGTIECLGSECPICKINKEIKLEYPEDYRKQKGYNPSSRRHYVNVLDRTLAKTCPSCQTEIKRGANGQFPPTCACGTFVAEVEPEPLNKVKIANISETGAQKANAEAYSHLDEENNPFDLWSADLKFTVIRAGNKKDITPAPLFENNDEINEDDYELFDLENVVIKLEPEEVVDFMNGVSFKDIFAARRDNDAMEFFDNDTKESLEKARERASELFNK